MSNFEAGVLFYESKKITVTNGLVVKRKTNSINQFKRKGKWYETEKMKRQMEIKENPVSYQLHTIDAVNTDKKYPNRN